MLDYFFSLKHADKKELFEGLAIWQEEKYQQLQGTYPVINLSFARVKEVNYANTIERLREIIRGAFTEYLFLKDSDLLLEGEQEYFKRILLNTANDVIPKSLFTTAFCCFV